MVIGEIFLVLILTILIEGAIYYIYRQDNNLVLASVALNLATNPFLNFVFLFFFTPSFKYVIPAEILVVILEYLLLSFIGYRGKRFFVLVVVANLASYLLGVILFNN
jgi:hypothetical protein